MVIGNDTFLKSPHLGLRSHQLLISNLSRVMLSLFSHTSDVMCHLITLLPTCLRGVSVAQVLCGFPRARTQRQINVVHLQSQPLKWVLLAEQPSDFTHTWYHQILYLKQGDMRIEMHVCL